MSALSMLTRLLRSIRKRVFLMALLSVVLSLCSLIALSWVATTCTDAQPQRQGASSRTYARMRRFDETKHTRICSWHAKHGDSRPQPPRKDDGQALVGFEMVSFFQSLYETYGVITIARNGWALGIYREHGQIRGDMDGDAMIIIPEGVEKSCVMALIKSFALQYSPSKTISLHEWGFLNNFMYDGFDSVVFWYRNASGPLNVTTFGVDMDILEERLVYNDDGFIGRMQLEYGNFTPRVLLDNLCRCPYFTSYLFCFESPWMEQYMYLQYGPSYMVPAPGAEGTGVGFANMRWFWRTSIGSWLVTKCRDAVSDFFVFIVD